MTCDDNPGVIAFPPFIWLVVAVISALVHFFLIQLPIMSYSACLVCGVVVVLLAPALAFSALVAMKTAGTNVNPAKPALTIVRSGPFRFTRNPMYLALCLLQVALGWRALSGIETRSAPLALKSEISDQKSAVSPRRSWGDAVAELEKGALDCKE